MVDRIVAYVMDVRRIQKQLIFHNSNITAHGRNIWLERYGLQYHC